jgi:two-component system chemotaxis sensor kinase CheA
VNQPEYLHIFLVETREHLLTMQRWLSVMAEQPENKDGLLGLFRSIHSIKGMAASMGFRRLAGLAHTMEDGLERLRRTGRLPAEAVEQLYHGLDLLEARLADVVAGRPEAPEGDDAATDPQDRVLSLQISMPGGALSHWLLLVNELMRLGTLQSCRPEPEKIAEGILPGMLEVDLLCQVDIEDILQRCRGISDSVSVETTTRADSEPGLVIRHGVGQATVRVSTNLLDRFVGLSGELLTARHRLQASLQQGLQEEIEGSCLQLDRLLGDLRHQVLDARMVPLEAVTATLPRLVRELCRSTGKTISLDLIGNDVRLDRAILEAMSEPLMHMVRNAVDHGIEERGTITIAARRDRDRVTLDVSDDGRGLDPAWLAERARQDGFLQAGQGAEMSEAELLQLICRPGFTTARRITEISGRGIGMDVVRHTVDQLGGTLQILSSRGQGVCFRFILPLTVSIVPVLLVEADGHMVALPLIWIEQTLDVPRQQLRGFGNSHTADLGDRQLRLVFLSGLLGLPGATGSHASTIVCELRGGHAGLVVDAVAGQKEVFVKPLAFPLNTIHGLSGATILGDGRVVFLVDPCALIPCSLSTTTKGDIL